MYRITTQDAGVAVRRLQHSPVKGHLVPVPKTAHFLKGPVPLVWLNRAALLPGKVLNVAIAIWWLQGMADGKPLKLTQKSLKYLNVKRNAASTALDLLQNEGLIQLERRVGQRPSISILPCIEQVGND